MARPTTWFTPLDRPPFVTEHHDPAGPPAKLHVLEISSRSGQMLGRPLSAMNLRAPGAEGDRGVTVESVYQTAKCYGAGGPAERPSPNGYEAKRIDRERRSAGPLRGFQHEGTFWPAASGSAFYDRLWIKATVAIHADRLHELKSYNAYSDQFHRPGRSVACQARAAAMLVGLDRTRQLDSINEPNRWADTLGLAAGARPQPADVPTKTPMPEKNARPAPPETEARVLVCGSRDFTDPGLVKAKLDEVRERLGGVPMRVISGAARGADRMAAEWAARNGVPCDEYPADWDRYGKSAGYRRNEQMLTEGQPHLVVAFPQGESRGTRMMMQIASQARVAVEEIDPASRTTLTDTGRLYDIAAIARRSAIPGRPAGPVEAPPVSRIAKLPNGDPRTHGEARVVIGGRQAGADERLVHAKLDEVLARAHPAALRIAVEMQTRRYDLSTVAASWARRRGVRCDQYRTADPAEAELTRRRMIAEQKPHMVVTFPRGEQSAERLAAIAARAGVPVEAVDARGHNHTRTGKLADLQKARQSREQAEPNPAWVVPIEGRTTAGTQQRLGRRAADAAWAKPGHASGEPPPTLNLRARSAFDALRSGAAVRIDRKTDWGNPFPLRDRNDPDERREVVEQYREYLAAAIDSGKVDIDKLARLDGKQLACHCAPQACHGDVLSQAATWAAGIEREHERSATPSHAREHARPPGRDADAPVDTHVFDAGDEDWDETPPPGDEKARTERPPDDAPQHPDDLAADRLEAYREKIAAAGAGDRQLEAIDASVATLRASAEQASAEQRDAPDRPMPAEMREKLEEHNRTVERGYHDPDGDVRVPWRVPAPPPLPAPAPPPAHEPTREVRVLVTGSWRHDEPAMVYAKLDEIRQRIAGAPMRIVTGDSRGAQATAANWARDAGVPCDVHDTDWDGARAQYEADAEKAANFDAAIVAIDKQYPPDADHSIPDPDDRDGNAARDPRQEALAELDEAVQWHEKGLMAYRSQAIAVRDEDMLNERKPHLVVSFDKPGDRGGAGVVAMANDREIPCERVDHHGRTVTPDDQRPDLKAIGRRTSDTLPEEPPKPPAPAAGSWQQGTDLDRLRGDTYDTAATR
ncbi:MAG: SLOG family protein [Acidobacteria bacterium]|nr:SLOG family protein [Acidobacteriota bacterium]